MFLYDIEGETEDVQEVMDMVKFGFIVNVWFIVVNTVPINFWKIIQYLLRLFAPSAVFCVYLRTRFLEYPSSSGHIFGPVADINKRSSALDLYWVVVI
jgi:hypothetical protein